MFSFPSSSSDKVFDFGGLNVAALDNALGVVLPEVLVSDLSLSFVQLLMIGVFLENMSFTGYTMTINQKQS